MLLPLESTKLDDDRPIPPSKSGFDDTEQPLAPPPAYDAPSGSSRPVVGVTRPNWTRGNHVYISSANGSVKGQWTIDPNLVIPPNLLPAVEDGERLDHFHVVSNNGSVKADLSLVSEKPTKSWLFAQSLNGSVQVRVVSFLVCFASLSHANRMP